MYCLLPFRFDRLSGRELIVNEVGDYMVLPDGIANWFISERPIPDLIDNYSVRLRTKKAFLDSFTALHIFVLTLRCNQNCNYCQTSSKEKECAVNYDMPEETIRHGIELMFKSPSPHLTMEFQGSESTLIPHLLKYAIETAEETNATINKDITYVLCTNCVNISEEILALCEKYGVIVSTSLDGFEALHNTNRGQKETAIKELLTE